MNVIRRVRRPTQRLWAVILASLILILIFAFRDQLDIASFAQQREWWLGWIEVHPVLAATAFVGIYLAVTALSLPGATALTLVGGSLFGLVLGTFLVSIASVVGATLAMMTARYLLRAAVESSFAEIIAKIDRGVERDGARYLFGLRLIPVIPFFLVNLAMGLTRMPVFTFVWVSQLGMLPVTFVYVNAGRQLISIDGGGDLLSVRLILAFLALAALPFVAKAGQNWWSDRSAMQSWAKPARYEYNVIVIGAGSAGLVTAYVAATARARVALIEEQAMGGDCLNSGCVPSKALIHSAKLAKLGRSPEPFGLTGRLEPSFTAVMARIQGVIAGVAPHDSAERYRSLGVEVVAGRAEVVDPWTVLVNGRRLTARRLIIATGAEPAVPPIPGLDRVQPLTSETVWSLTERPERLLVVGGGAIGCELAQAFARLGSRVTIVEAMPRLLAREDEEVSEAITATLAGEGVEVLSGVGIARFAGHEAGASVDLDDGRTIMFDRVIVAAGRKPRTQGFGLERLGLLENGRLVVDERLRTRLPSIYAAGDVIGRLQFTHAAGHYAWFAAMNALFAGVRFWSVTTKAFPIVIYTDPEIARVGLSESEANEKGLTCEVTRYALGELDRAIIEGTDRGFVKVLTAPGKDRILGVTIVGERAGDMLGEFTLAMTHGLGLNAVLGTIHPYPGWTDAAKAVAGAWRRAHAPGWALGLSARFLRWQRG